MTPAQRIVELELVLEQLEPSIWTYFDTGEAEDLDTRGLAEAIVDALERRGLTLVDGLEQPFGSPLERSPHTDSSHHQGVETVDNRPSSSVPRA